MASYVEPIGAYHMIGKDAYEPQRSTNYWIHIYGLDDLGLKNNATDEITLCVNKIDGIDYSVGSIEVPYGNTKVKFAGLPEFKDINIVFNDFIGKNTQEILSKWFALVFNPDTQVIGRASRYKKSGQIIETAPDGSMERSWTLYGAWPSNLSIDGHEYGSDSQVKINMTLKVDYVKPGWSLA